MAEPAPTNGIQYEHFLAGMVRDLVATLQSALGDSIAASCLSDVGLAIGARSYMHRSSAGPAHQLAGTTDVGTLSPEEYAEFSAALLSNLFGQVTWRPGAAGQLEFCCESWDLTVAGERAVDCIATGILGAVASLNFGTVWVVRHSAGQERQVRHDVYLEGEPLTGQGTGEEFHPEIVRAFASLDTQLRIQAENRFMRERLQESATEYLHRNRQITAAARIASIVSQSLDSQEIFQVGLQLLMEAVGVDAGAIFRLDDASDQLILAHVQGMSEDEANHLLFDEILAHSSEPGSLMRLLLAERRHCPPGWRSGEYQCYALTPMRFKATPIGLVLLFARLRHSFAPLELDLLELAANELGVGIENIRLYDFLARQVRRMIDLREISYRLNRSNRPEDVLDIAAESITRELGFDRVGIFLIDDSGEYLVQVRGTDEEGGLFRTAGIRVPLEPHAGTLARSVIEGKPLHVVDLSSEMDLEIPSDEAEGLQQLRISAFARVPLITEGRAVGAISVDNMIRRRPISQDDLNMLMILGNHVAVALDNARYVEALQRSSEELRRVDAIRSQFVSMISHEFRSPLHKIRNATLLLAEDETDPQRRRFARSILSSAEYLTFLVNNLLAQSRMEQTALTVDARRVRVRDLAVETVKEMKAAVLSGSQQVEVQVPEDLEVVADPPYLKLILVNLLNNASKASPPDGHIRISAYASAGAATICVRDFGIGIPEDRQQQIFDKFVSWYPEGGRKVSGGVGLGLHICRSLVEAHGGHIRVTSQPGEGAEFCFTLPSPLTEPRE